MSRRLPARIVERIVQPGVWIGNLTRVRGYDACSHGTQSIQRMHPARATIPSGMSIIYTLKKLVDPIAARAEETQLKKAREDVRRQQSGDPPAPPEADTDGAAPLRFRCRCCGMEQARGAYCPVCLADTMEPLEAPAVETGTARGSQARTGKPGDPPLQNG